MVPFFNLPNQSIPSFSSSCQMLLSCHFLQLVFSFISANPTAMSQSSNQLLCYGPSCPHVRAHARGCDLALVRAPLPPFYFTLSSATQRPSPHIILMPRIPRPPSVTSVLTTRDPSSLTWQTCSESSTSLALNQLVCLTPPLCQSRVVE